MIQMLLCLMQVLSHLLLGVVSCEFVVQHQVYRGAFSAPFFLNNLKNISDQFPYEGSVVKV